MMLGVYLLGVFLGFLFGVPVGFWIGARHIEKQIQRREDEENRRIMELLDWQE